MVHKVVGSSVSCSEVIQVNTYPASMAMPKDLLNMHTNIIFCSENSMKVWHKISMMHWFCGTSHKLLTVTRRVNPFEVVQRSGAPWPIAACRRATFVERRAFEVVGDFRMGKYALA